MCAFADGVAEREGGEIVVVVLGFDVVGGVFYCCAEGGGSGVPVAEGACGFVWVC